MQHLAPKYVTQPYPRDVTETVTRRISARIVLVSLAACAGVFAVAGPAVTRGGEVKPIDLVVAVDESGLSPAVVVHEKAAATIALDELSSQSKVTVFGFASHDASEPTVDGEQCVLRPGGSAADREAMGQCIQQRIIRREGRGEDTDFVATLNQRIAALSGGDRPPRTFPGTYRWWPIGAALLLLAMLVAAVWLVLARRNAQDVGGLRFTLYHGYESLEPVLRLDRRSASSSSTSASPARTTSTTTRRPCCRSGPARTATSCGTAVRAGCCWRTPAASNRSRSASMGGPASLPNVPAYAIAARDDRRFPTRREPSTDDSDFTPATRLADADLWDDLGGFDAGERHAVSGRQYPPGGGANRPIRKARRRAIPSGDIESSEIDNRQVASTSQYPGSARPWTTRGEPRCRVRLEALLSLPLTRHGAMLTVIGTFDQRMQTFVGNLGDPLPPSTEPGSVQ